jgi:hypothetical protein
MGSKVEVFLVKVYVQVIIHRKQCPCTGLGMVKVIPNQRKGLWSGVIPGQVGYTSPMKGLSQRSKSPEEIRSIGPIMVICQNLQVYFKIPGHGINYGQAFSSYPRAMVVSSGGSRKNSSSIWSSSPS